MEIQIQHNLHKHPLTLRENGDDLLCPGCGDPSFGKSYNCSKCDSLPRRCLACGEDPYGSVYTCMQCWPFSPLFHKSCGDLPKEIQIGYRPHCALQFEKKLLLQCDFCNQAHWNFMFYCNVCDFQMGLECVVMFIKHHEGREHIQHPHHRHPLAVLEANDVNCKLCSKSISNSSCGCVPCKFYVHSSCAEFLPEIPHPFHPRHALTLDFQNQGRYQCKACCFDFQGLRYRCEECDFDIHPACTSLNLRIIKHEIHEHLLTLVENISHRSRCQACGLEIHGVFFLRCVECSLDFHVHCDALPLPPTLMPKHHNHPLILKEDSELLHCSACGKEKNPEHPSYFCGECEYYAHVYCAISEVEKLLHFTHNHFLFPLGNERNDDIICFLCEKYIQLDPAYGCESDPCKFYLHKSCAELPREKQHPFHRHPLVLSNSYVKHRCKCQACNRDCYGFTYCCGACNFYLDLNCSSLHPSIKFEGHEHVLTFFEKLFDSPECQRCKANPPDKFTPLDVSYFRCVKCNFNVHFMCSPLPQTMKHESHQHSLTLMDNSLDLFDCYYDDEYYYCDLCETRRDPHECVYYCEDCSFVVGTHCLVSEIIDCLEQKHRDVKRRVVNRRTTEKMVSRGFTYEDFVNSLTQEEKELMEVTVKNINEEVIEEWKEINHQDDAGISNKDPLWFKARDYAKGKLPFKELDVYAELVNVQGCTITPKFAPLLSKLLDKHGDIGASSSLTQRLKTIPIVLFCVIVHRMSNALIMDTEEEPQRTLEWWYYLALVRRAEFNIDFAFDHLKRILPTRLELRAKISRHDYLYDVPKKIAQLSQEINNLTAEVDQRKIDIQKQKKQAQDVIFSESSKLSRSELKHLCEALEEGCKSLATGLL